MMTKQYSSAVETHFKELRELSEATDFTVFLCGPTLKGEKSEPSARLRQRLIDLLTEDGFDVVLGEDDGLENARIQVGLNAQDNELEFVSEQCNAIILLADSVGAFCELGLFSWHYVHADGRLRKEVAPTFVVLVDREYQDQKSYLNEGPVSSLNGFGDVQFVDYANFDTKGLLKKLNNVRSIQSLDRRGRPRQQRR